MEWCYMEGERQAGPVSDADFQALVGSGRAYRMQMEKLAPAPGMAG